MSHVKNTYCNLKYCTFTVPSALMRVPPLAGVQGLSVHAVLFA